MKLACREYVSRKHLGDRMGCIRMTLPLSDQLDRLAEQRLIRGYLMRVLITDEDIIYEQCDKAEILEGSCGILPALWLNVTFDADSFDCSILAGLEAEMELYLLFEFVDPF